MRQVTVVVAQVKPRIHEYGKFLHIVRVITGWSGHRSAGDVIPVRPGLDPCSRHMRTLYTIDSQLLPTPPVLSVSGPELQLVRGSDRERIQDGYRYQVEVRTSRWTCCLMDDAMRVIRNFHTRAREHRRARRNSGSPLPITDVIPRGVDRGYRTRLTPRMRLLRRPGSRASDPPMSTSVVAPAVPDPARFSTPSPAAPLGTQAASLSDDALSSRSWVVRCWCSSWRCHARARALVRVEGDRLRGLAYRSPRRTKRSTPNRPS